VGILPALEIHHHHLERLERFFLDFPKVITFVSPPECVIHREHFFYFVTRLAVVLDAINLQVAVKGFRSFKMAYKSPF
jgi:hypothetical protein